MMVLIMTNINYLVILICSTVFLLSSFVSTQQKLKNLEDPREFYNYALYLRTHHPKNYAKHYYGIVGYYNKLIRAAEAKRISSDTRTSNNNGKRNVITNSAGQDDRSSKLARGIPRDVNARPKSEEKAGKLQSRSLNSPMNPKEEVFENARRAMSGADNVNFDLEWIDFCFTLGYNNTNGSCQSEPEVVKLASNETICRSYFKFGCHYQSNRNFCVTAVNEVLKNTTFNCDINIIDDNDLMSVQCCLSCKNGRNEALSKEKCEMHMDDSMPSLAQDSCCKFFLNQNASVSTTESIPTSFKPGSMNDIMSNLDDQIANSTTLKLNNSSAATTESMKPGSLNEIVAHLEDRFSNNEANELKIDSSTVPETSTLPTPTTTTTTTTTTTPTAITTVTPSTTTESTTAPSTTTTAETTTATTTELTTTASTTTTESPIPSETPVTAIKPFVRSSDAEHAPEDASEDASKDAPDGYKSLDAKKNLYEKIDEHDRSKADFLVILNKTLMMEKEKKYNDFTLMNITLRRNIRCNWEFNIEKVDPEQGVEPLTAKDFRTKPEKYRFILLIDSEEVQPQTIKYSVSCNIKQYKYYKYIVNLTIKEKNL